MLKQPAALLRRHIVQLRQTVPHRLLRLRRKIPKTGLIRKRPLLFGKRKVAVTIHPLRQMLLLLPLPLPRPRSSQSRMPLKSPSACPSRLASSHSHTQTQQQASKRWLETTPEFGWKSHDIHDGKNLYVLVTKLDCLMQLTSFRLPSRQIFTFGGYVVGGAVALSSGEPSSCKSWSIVCKA
jgi:hypothetical protein